MKKAESILLLCMALALALLAGISVAEDVQSHFNFENTTDTATVMESGAWVYPIAREILEDPEDVLRLVNKENLLGKSYPDEATLVKTTVRKVSNSAMQLRDLCNEAMQRMFDAADADGITLYLHSAYRNFRTQEVLYYNRLKDNGGKDDGVVQKEGASEHQTGLGADVISKAWIGKKFNVDFADTDEAKWMAANCARFGFIIRYPEGRTDITGIMYEPWHLRYVGVEVAQYMTEKGLTLEEFAVEAALALAGTWVLPEAEDDSDDVIVETFVF